MRKLGKRFSKKYNFKRLLQTTPNLSKLYNKHEDAVNSIKPIRHVQLISLEKIQAFDPEVILDVNATCSVETYGPGSGNWPCRIKYAEQILDINSNGYSAWVVRIRQSGPKDATVDVLQYQKPFITTIYPVSWDASNTNRPIYDANKLARIDQLDENKFVTYYLMGENDKKPIDPIDLRTCGIIPHSVLYGYYSTFYEREIAHLYADSLQKVLDIRHWDNWGSF